MAPENPPIDPRTHQMLDSWKRKLIDLTRRNRALNFVPTRVSTLTIIDEVPAAVFRRLYLREQPMRFQALETPAVPPEITASSEIAAQQTAPPPDAPVLTAAQPASNDEAAFPTAPPSPPKTAPELDDEEEVLAGDADRSIADEDDDFVPYESAELHERHTDEWLQTTSAPEALDKSLRRIDELCLIAAEEQGVSTLFLTLGMIEYRDSHDDRELQRAPLIMLPVRLLRRSARSGYTLRSSEDDAILNPALAELLRRNFDLDLPELPTSDALDEEYDLDAYFEQVREEIAHLRDWSVKPDIHLALFAFQKLVMYQDLDTHAESAARHPLIHRLATREGSHQIGLPKEIQDLDLDREFSPESTFQVVDADSSQLRAIAAVAREHDLVIEGPPGTGKSQTITNIIATSLAAGKSVLFVAEKRAALSVVFNRLVAAGLGEFCLELHASKANKRAVVRQLGDALDASLERVDMTLDTLERLPQTREALNEYVRAVSEPFGALAITPFQACGEYSQVRNAPHFAYDEPAEEVTRAQLDDALRNLDTLARTAANLQAPPHELPWRDATRTVYLPTDCEEIARAGNARANDFAELEQTAAAVAEHYGFSALASFADMEVADEAADLFVHSPGVSTTVLEDPLWDQLPASASKLIDQGRALAQLRTQVDAMFKPGACERDHADDIAFIQEKLGGTFGFLAFLNARFRATKTRWLAYRQFGYDKPLLLQGEDLRLVDRLRQRRAALEADDEEARKLFGAHWKGEQSDWDALSRFADWVVRFRRFCLDHKVDIAAAARTVSRANPDVAELTQLTDTARRMRGALSQFSDRVGWAPDYFDRATFETISQRAREVASATPSAPAWAGFEAARQATMKTPARAFAVAAMRGHLAFGDLRRSFTRAFYARWLATCLRMRPVLERFNALEHEGRIGDFRRMDRSVLEENRTRLIGQLRDRVQARLKASDAAAGMVVLRRELARQRGHQPLRRTMHAAGAAIRAIKPCFMMSPLTVAQYLDGSEPSFDLVVFDEASQLPAEDAAGAIMRGKQVVVVGDPKQLPPTTFFSTTAHSVATHDDDLFSGPDPESVLEDFMGTGMPTCRLKWHYRSAHESLISFSNTTFYDGELLTFPSVEIGNEFRGVSFEFVEGGVYEGKGLNLVEARRVADAVVEFSRQQIERAKRGEPMDTLGVGTFNLRQQLAIQDELERRRREDPTIESFFDREALEPFFVKNLENIQGDERDVIFLSVTYAQGADGKLRRNFGPLNGDNGWRRLNVITTRARQRMRVFASMRGEDIAITDEGMPGPRLLRDFLLFAEHGRLDGEGARLRETSASLFEQDLAQTLRESGYEVTPRVGAAGYRIDLAVGDGATPARYLCGIECDGITYQASETARDRDRLRWQVLETRGWNLTRAWSTSWFLDRDGQRDRLMRHLEQLRESAREKHVEERDVREAEVQTEPEGADAADETTENEIPYERPEAEPYAEAPRHKLADKTDLPELSDSQLKRVIISVVEAEAPIHHSQLCARLVSMWETRTNQVIIERIGEAALAAEDGGAIYGDGEFWYRKDGVCHVRCRVGLRPKAEHIAPDEYRAAVLKILEQGHGFARERLVAEVRSLFGFTRTGPALDEAVRAAINDLLAQDAVGEGSTGITLRP